MRNLLSRKIQNNAKITHSTEVLRVTDVEIIMQQYIPTFWHLTGTTADDEPINLYYLRKFTGRSEEPKPGEIIIADLLKTPDLSGGFNEIVDMKRIFHT